jgi:flagellar biosynthesis/type III secretory pathway protein FliH
MLLKSQIIGIIVLLVIISGVSQCGNCSSPSSSSSDSGYNSGYNSGYKDGYNKAKQEFQNSGYNSGYKDGYDIAKQEFQNSGYNTGYNTAKNEYQKTIDNLAKDYEIEIQNTYQKGFSDGEISMKNQITTKIELDAKNKARQGDWNAILFDLKD